MTKRQILYDPTYRRHLRQPKSQTPRVERWLPGDEGSRNRGARFLAHGATVVQDNRSPGGRWCWWLRNENVTVCVFPHNKDSMEEMNQGTNLPGGRACRCCSGWELRGRLSTQRLSVLETLSSHPAQGRTHGSFQPAGSAHYSGHTSSGLKERRA